MFTFEIGHKYYDTSACDHNCVFTIEIVKRTAKTVTFLRNGKERRTKLFCDERGEYIIPYRYSMAPVFRAEYEVQLEEAPADVAEAPPLLPWRTRPPPRWLRSPSPPTMVP